MTSAPALACPRCRKALRPESWRDESRGRCHSCGTDFEFFGFPALRAVKAQIAPQAAVLAAESVCFFHADNRATAICEGCGRLLCDVCTVPIAGQKLCPTCIAKTKSTDLPTVVRERVLYDHIALVLAVFPILLGIFTLITAPAALGIVIYGWRKPGSLVARGTRIRLAVAGVVTILEIAFWAYALFNFGSHRRF